MPLTLQRSADPLQPAYLKTEMCALPPVGENSVRSSAFWPPLGLVVENEMSLPTNLLLVPRPLNTPPSSIPSMIVSDGPTARSGRLAVPALTERVPGADRELGQGDRVGADLPGANAARGQCRGRLAGAAQRDEQREVGDYGGVAGTPKASKHGTPPLGMWFVREHDERPRRKHTKGPPKWPSVVSLLQRPASVSAPPRHHQVSERLLKRQNNARDPSPPPHSREPDVRSGPSRRSAALRPSLAGWIDWCAQPQLAL